MIDTNSNNLPDPLRADPSPVTEIIDRDISDRGVRLLVKRDDLISNIMPGNKFRKLKYNIAEMIANGSKLLLTFGGAYSNHIYATAAVSHRVRIRAIGVIRGESHEPLNPVLDFAVRHGMTLAYMDRETYRHKYDPSVLASLRDQFGDFFLVPEGGSNCNAVKGCREILQEVDVDYDVVVCPVGTGGTLAGIVTSLPETAVALGLSVLKGGAFLSNNVDRLTQQCGLEPQPGRWSINTDYHFGGYAKTTLELRAFTAAFSKHHRMLVDNIYTGKMFYGLFDMIKVGSFSRGTTILAIHTGGIDWLLTK